MKNCYLLLIVYLGLVQFSEAQDYLITNKGDTVRGEIKLLSFDLLDRVQVKAGKGKKIYTAKETMLCSLKGESYRPVRQDNAIRMMKVIKYGYLSLYAFNAPSQHTYDKRMLTKLDGTFMEVPNLLFTKIMVNYLDDCPTIREKIKSEDYGKKDLEKIVDEYNACLDEKTRAAAVASSAAALTNPKLEALGNLKTKVEALESFSSKKDALELINDLTQKVNNKEIIPNYLLEGLNGYLGGQANIKEALDSVLSKLR